MTEENDLLKNIEKKIKSGHEMIEELIKLKSNIDGVDKLSRKINQEIKFLNKVRCVGNLKKEYLQSTNLIHLNAVVERLLKEWSQSTSKSNQFISVMKPFKMESTNSRLLVDIITDEGNNWIKVIARNPKALTLISLGNGEYGQKSIIDQAECYLNCASIHPNCYKIPNIVFHFACGIESSLATQLEELGVIVEGERISNEIDEIIPLNDYKLNDNSEAAISNVTFDKLILQDNLDVMSTKLLNIELLNLDVSCLLAYVSNMTNGHSDFIYLEPLLTLQAEAERLRPVKIVLDKWFEGKQLLVCKTAYDNFMDIMNTIGGSNEMLSVEKLMKRVKIVEDATEGRILQLPLVGKIKHRSRLVFASGEATKSITVSANEGFIRAAKMRDVDCAVMLHEPRSLSEMKEKYATKITDTVDREIR